MPDGSVARSLPFFARQTQVYLSRHLGKKKKKTHLFWKDLSEGQARPIPPFLTTQTACLRVTWGLVEMRILGSSDT